MKPELLTRDQVANPIRWLNELDRHSLPEAGGKGAHLGEMTQAGLPVPPGFVVTANVYRALLEVDGLGQRITDQLQNLDYQEVSAVTAASQKISTWIMETSIPGWVQISIRQAYTQLCAQQSSPEFTLPVAVRSSATAEDLPNASFAGQQETFLNICSPEAVLQAVHKCWAGLWTPQAIFYRAGINGMGRDQLSVALAVVVQTMIPADVAGVMFTANPVTGNRAEILINASYGLGESVVSGAVTPDTFILSEAGLVREQVLGTKETCISPNGCGTRVSPVPENERTRFCLNSADLAALSALARRVQAHYGSPQDTEWALSAGKLYLLQARPITTLVKTEAANAARETTPIELPLMAKPPRGIENTIDHIPEPPMPLDMAIIANNAFILFFEQLGFRPPAEPPTPVERSDGRVGLRLPEPSPTPAILWRFPAHLVYILRTDPMAHWKPLAEEMSGFLQSLEQERLATQEAVKLARLMSRSVDKFSAIFARRFLAAFFPGILYSSLLSFWVRKAVGKADALALDNQLYRTTPYPTALQNQALANLARLERRAGRESHEFKTSFSRFLADWGHRPVRGMIALPSSPTWSEQPEIVERMVEALLSNQDAIQAGEQEQAHLEQAFQADRARVEQALNPLFRRWFRLHLERARKALVVREEGLSLAEDYSAFFRRSALQLGRKLVGMQILDQPEDIFYLLLPELEPTAQGKLADIRDRVARRKQGYHKLLAAHARGQHWLFATGSIPPLAETQSGSPAGSQALKGLAASQGQVTGRVCLIQGPQEFGKMRKGDILVAPFTAPAWTPLFGLASAVVTDIGSLASHAAIVAREYGIPCVVAVSGATKVLQDGQWIQVDGMQGMVTVLETPDCPSDSPGQV